VREGIQAPRGYPNPGRGYARPSFVQSSEQ